MKHMSFVKSTILAIAVSVAPITADAATKAELKEQYALAESYRLGTAAPQDFGQAFALMATLADQGYARAQDKLGYYYSRGIGTPVDLDAAAIWYRKAIENDREASRISYGKLLLKTGDTAQALEQLTLAANADMRGAKAQLAASHHEGAFGDLSDRGFGTGALAALAQQGDPYAIRFVLVYIAKGSRFDLDLEQLKHDALAIATNPEDRARAKIAEALVPFLRSTDKRGTADLRAELLKTTGIRDKIRLAESLYLALETQPAQFWTASEAIVDTAGRGDFARALFLTSRINKNAYVRILQKELRDLGYYRGRVSGYMTGSTIRAMWAFCNASGISKECRYGPLKSRTIKALTNSLAQTI